MQRTKFDQIPTKFRCTYYPDAILTHHNFACQSKVPLSESVINSGLFKTPFPLCRFVVLLVLCIAGLAGWLAVWLLQGREKPRARTNRSEQWKPVEP